MNSNTQEQDVLQAAIEQLYTTFAVYPGRRRSPMVRPGVSNRDLEPLLLTPPRFLTLDELSFYLSESVMAWTAVEDFKHFLPRLLECLSRESSGYRYWDYPDFLGQKLRQTRWQSWVEPEQQVVLDYFIVLWRFVLSAFPSPHPDFRKASLFLRCLAHFIEDPEPFLVLWQQAPSLAALRHLAQFVLEEAADIAGGQNTWWDRWEQGKWERGRQEQVKRWLLSPLTCRILEEAFYRYSDEPVAQEFIQAHDWLSVLLL